MTTPGILLKLLKEAVRRTMKAYTGAKREIKLWRGLPFQLIYSHEEMINDTGIISAVNVKLGTRGRAGRRIFEGVGEETYKYVKNLTGLHMKIKEKYLTLVKNKKEMNVYEVVTYDGKK
jgi:hypothetical protein